jgi:hypothetical protein
LVESANTQVVGLWTHGSGASIVLSFSSPVKTFGFEARPFDHPEAPLPQTVSVSFYKSNRFWLWQPLSSPFDDPGNVQVVGTIDRRIHEDEGALLFAASTTTEYFTHVLIGFRQGAAIARLRYSVGEQPAPTHGDLFTIRNGVRTDQVTMNVGEELNLTYLVRFRNTWPEFLDVSLNEHTAIFTDPPMGWHAGTLWKATEATRNKIFPIYARYHEPYTGLSITDTIRVYVRP